MANQKEEIVVNDNYDLIEEVHTRIDALAELLEEKGILYEGELLKKIEEIASRSD